MSANELSPDQARQLGVLVDVHPEARELGERFADAGHELYLVGGSIRDTLLSRGEDRVLADIDLDFATSAHPEDTEAILEPWADALWLTGARFGTVSAERDGRQIEITTFRSDEYDYDSRHPEVTFGDDIEGDLARRDFTINAMAVRVPEFEFVDLFGGLSDLNKRILRTPIDPHTSFGDDPLRMVRLARFAATLDAAPDPATQAAAGEMAQRLETVSAERVRDELDKLMAADQPGRGIDLLVETGLAAWSVPELIALRECRDPMHRHKDVYAHTLAVVDNAIELEDDGPDLVLRWAALLHDIGKPKTRRIHDDGTVTFHHHEVEGGRLARHRLRELRFDKERVKSISELVRLHLRFHTYKMGWTDSAVRRYVRDAGPLLEQLNKLTRADVTTGNPNKAARIQRRMDELEERIEALQEQEELDKLRPPVDGNQIMRHLGIDPGPLVGEAWNHLLEERIERGPMSEEEAYEELDRWWAAQREAGDEPDA
ncbi:MAG: CCA tRNA nucleotidyltransferase [Nitriliruptorales bacterium]|nr:CCA tRNA nucleotidyltransferase [Nitriliruptorales bacterium]